MHRRWWCSGTGWCPESTPCSCSPGTVGCGANTSIASPSAPARQHSVAAVSLDGVVVMEPQWRVGNTTDRDWPAPGCWVRLRSRCPRRRDAAYPWLVLGQVSPLSGSAALPGLKVKPTVGGARRRCDRAAERVRAAGAGGGVSASRSVTRRWTRGAWWCPPASVSAVPPPRSQA